LGAGGKLTHFERSEKLHLQVEKTAIYSTRNSMEKEKPTDFF